MKYAPELTWDEIYVIALAKFKSDKETYQSIGKLTADERIHSLALGEVAETAIEFWREAYDT